MFCFHDEQVNDALSEQRWSFYDSPLDGLTIGVAGGEIPVDPPAPDPYPHASRDLLRCIIWESGWWCTAVCLQHPGEVTVEP